MSTYALLMAAPALVLLVWAAAIDLGSRRIPNWLTFSLVIGGIVQSLVFGATTSPGASLLGLLVGFSIPFVLFAMGALGGGDVKLLAGVGAWLGPIIIIKIFLAAAIVGMVIVLVQ